MRTHRLPQWLRWTISVPVVAVVLLAATWGRDPGPVLLVIEGVFLVGAVIAAVHHAEVVAHKVGEPYGSLVLAVAVTVIEVALIVTLMLAGKLGAPGAPCRLPVPLRPALTQAPWPVTTR